MVPWNLSSRQAFPTVFPKFIFRKILAHRAVLEGTIFTEMRTELKHDNLRYTASWQAKFLIEGERIFDVRREG